MIRGVVNSDLEATIRLRVDGSGGRSSEVIAIIDTGFQGSLSLPPDVIARLALTALAPRTVRLADQSTRVVDSYEGDVVWDGRSRTIRVLALEGDPLVGTALLEGHTLTATFVRGGEVRIEAIP